MVKHASHSETDGSLATARRQPENAHHSFRRRRPRYAVTATARHAILLWRGVLMPTSPSEVRKLAADQGVQIVDLRFIDLPGIWQHFSIPVEDLDDDLFGDGIGFDGSSIRGYQ